MRGWFLAKTLRRKGCQGEKEIEIEMEIQNEIKNEIEIENVFRDTWQP